MVAGALRTRLLYAKYLLRSSRETLLAGLSFSHGLALLNLQDAAEMILRVIAEHVGAPYQRNFDGVIKAVEDKSGKPVPFKAHLIRLNVARVGFKHHGTLPERADVEDFAGRTESFAEAGCRDFLGEEFERISLADLIHHHRVRRHLRKAEEHLERGELRPCHEECAIAFHHLFLRVADTDLLHNERRPSGVAHYGGEEEVARQVRTLLEWDGKAIEGHTTLLRLLLHGVSLPEYSRFRVLTPTVRVFSGKPQSYHDGLAEKDLRRDDALFCIRFVLDTAARMEAAPVPGRWREPPRSFRAKNRTPLLDEPDQGAEVLRWVEQDEDLLADASAASDPEGYVRIVEHNALTYVAADAVEQLKEPETDPTPLS